jgi:hypothetical protein
MAIYERTADRRLPDPAISEQPLVGAFARLYGAPLDFIKTAAAGFMVLDHYNTIILNRADVWLFRFGRIAMPLFCFAVAAHVVRSYASGREGTSRQTLQMLLVFAVVTQPFYSWAFQTAFGNVLFTLVAAAAVAAFMPTLHPVWRHLGLAAALAAFWLVPQYANAPSDYGFAGMFFPATIALTVLGGLQYLPWVVAYGISLNGIPQIATWDVIGGRAAEGWWVEPAIDALFALGGGAVILAISTVFIGRARFLPRYALHVFYPGHIGLLALLRTLLPLLPH